MSDWPWDSDILPKPLLPRETTFEGFLNLEWDELNADSAVVRLTVRDDPKQPLGLLHGGINSAVAETARPRRPCCVTA